MTVTDVDCTRSWTAFECCRAKASASEWGNSQRVLAEEARQGEDDDGERGARSSCAAAQVVVRSRGSALPMKVMKTGGLPIKKRMNSKKTIKDVFDAFTEVV
ncbi:uncharacterized protein A4U43_C04F31560 [Asparagus officinalis]|uniref:Uncharacterized protein n=1 Tax=Asparagus officinalis TaxID=4686 RepID=A0A5P1F5Q8_ASPOF|nr:uncharacterized protein A4U43_C04F31560 [Asparagus officinalis]